MPELNLKGLVLLYLQKLRFVLQLNKVCLVGEYHIKQDKLRNDYSHVDLLLESQEIALSN